MSIRWNNKIDLTGATKKIQAAGRRGLKAAGDEVLDEAQSLAPYDTGELHNSGKVLRVQNMQVSIVFTAEHAERQHEDLTLNHPNGGQAKFLEQPMRQADFAEAVAAEIRKELR